MIDNSYDFLISNFVNNCLFDKADQTKKTYEYNLKRFCRWADREALNINSISEQEIKKYTIYLTSKNISTVRQQIHIIARFMKFSTGKEFNIRVILSECITNKVNSITFPNIEIEDIRKLAEKARKDNNLRDAALLNIFFCTGLRVSEVENLNRTDLKETGLGAYLDVNVCKKVDRHSHSTRRIPIEPKCAECLKKYIKLRSDSNCAMFLNKNGQRLSIRGIQDILKKYGVSGQALRKSFIMGLVDKGINAAEIASLMGHKSAEMTLRYLDLNVDYKNKVFKTLSELYKKSK